MINQQVTKVEVSAAIVANNPFDAPAAVITDWIQFCDVQTATQVTYNKAILNFVRYLKNNEISQPARQDVIDYREFLLAEGYKVSSVRLYLTICKKFFDWLASKMIYPNVADGVKLPAMPTDEHSRDALTFDEAKQVISSFDDKKSEQELRNRAIMCLMIGAGLRSVEIVRLDVGDLEKRQGQFFLRIHGKARSGKTDSVKISPELKKILDDYLSFRIVLKKNQPMFTAISNRNYGKRLQTQSISRIAKKIFVKNGIESSRVTCHSCRHSAATLMLKSGVDIRQVQRVLRHRSATTTEIYLHDLNAFDNQGVEILSKIIFKGVA